MKASTEQRVMRIVGLVLTVATTCIYFVSHFMHLINEPPAWELGLVFLLGVFFVIEPRESAKLVSSILRSAVKYMKRILNLDE